MFLAKSYNLRHSLRTDNADDWVLHHENAPAHTELLIREFLEKENIPALPHPPYSPDLARCYFYLFPKLKPKLKGHHFGTMENIQEIVTDGLHTHLRKMTSGTAMISGKKNIGTIVLC